jgi:hypothetical protein
MEDSWSADDDKDMDTLASDTMKKQQAVSNS